MKIAPKFKIEQIAICPANPTKARKLLDDLGLSEWFHDNVHAAGIVRGVPGENHAHLQFNYQAGNGADATAGKPLELEILHYTDGHNWMTKNGPSVSHLGMHVNAEELEQFRAYFYENEIGVAQEVNTMSHTNPSIKDSRRYQYVIFDTKDILGVDLKFIVRKDLVKVAKELSLFDHTNPAHWPVQGAKRAPVRKAVAEVKKTTKSKR